MNHFKVIGKAATSIGEFVGRAKPAVQHNETLKAIQTGLRNDGRPIPIIAGLAGVNAFALDTFATAISKPPSLADLQATVPVLFPHLSLTDKFEFAKRANTENVNAPPRSAAPVTIVHLSMKDEEEMEYLKHKLGLRAYDHTEKWSTAKVWDAASLNAESQRINREDEKMFFRDVPGGMVSTLHACQYWKLTCLRIDQSRLAEQRAQLIRRSIQVSGNVEDATVTGTNQVRHAVVMFGARACVPFVRDNMVRLATMLAQDAAIAEKFPAYHNVQDHEFGLCKVTAAHTRAAYAILAQGVEGKHVISALPREMALLIYARTYLSETDAPVAPQITA